jgi:hypothetical protein
MDFGWSGERVGNRWRMDFDWCVHSKLIGLDPRNPKKTVEDQVGQKTPLFTGSNRWARPTRSTLCLSRWRFGCQRKWEKAISIDVSKWVWVKLGTVPRMGQKKMLLWLFLTHIYPPRFPDWPVATDPRECFFLGTWLKQGASNGPSGRHVLSQVLGLCLYKAMATQKWRYQCSQWTHTWPGIVLRNQFWGSTILRQSRYDS